MFEHMSAERFIAAFIMSNGGVLAMSDEAMTADYSKKAIQVIRDEKSMVHLFSLIDAESIEEVEPNDDIS